MPTLGNCKHCGKITWGGICRSCYYEFHESKEELECETKEENEEEVE